MTCLDEKQMKASCGVIRHSTHTSTCYSGRKSTVSYLAASSRAIYQDGTDLRATPCAVKDSPVVDPISRPIKLAEVGSTLLGPDKESAVLKCTALAAPVPRHFFHDSEALCS